MELQELIAELAMWNRIVATDREALSVALKGNAVSTEELAAAHAADEASRDTLHEIELRCVKMGIMTRTSAYTYISKEELA